MLPATFVNAVQLRLRLPLSLLAGVTTSKCGAATGCYGDHTLTCRACMSDRTPCHDRVVNVVARMAQTANMHVPHSARRPRARAASLAYPPNWRPDLTLLRAARDGNRMIVDGTCPSVATQTQAAMPATSHMPLAAATLATAAEKHLKYGKVLRIPHTIPPFVVENAGGINKEEMEFAEGV